jgi:hypothetical protein
MMSSHQGTLGRIEDVGCGPRGPWLHPDLRRGSEQNDPQRREDAAHHGEHHLQGRLRGFLLRALAALAPHLVRLDAEDLADAGAELLRLDDRLDEVVKVIHPALTPHLVHGLQARAAEAYLSEDLGEHVRQRVLVFVRHPSEGGIETKPGVNRDHEEVHRVRKALLDLRATPVDLLLQPEHRQVVAEDHAKREAADDVQRACQQQTEQQAQRAKDCGRDQTHGTEVGRREVAGSPGHLQPVVQVLPRLRRRRPRKGVAQPLDHRAQEALAERPRQLHFLERQRLVAAAGAVNLKALLNHLRRVGLGRAAEADEKHQDADPRDDRQNQSGTHWFIPRWRPRAG